VSAPRLASTLPSGPAYTVVLICHVAAVLVGIVAVVASGVAAARVLAARGGPLSSSVRTYFAPGVNWAGRVLYLVPVFGVALVELSHGVYPLSATWVLCGIGLWVSAMILAEGALWPAERRVQRALAATGTSEQILLDTARACRTVCLSAIGVLALLLTAMTVMLAKP
jgi:uncharacterized membrane protein